MLWRTQFAEILITLSIGRSLAPSIWRWAIPTRPLPPWKAWNPPLLSCRDEPQFRRLPPCLSLFAKTGATGPRLGDWEFLDGSILVSATRLQAVGALRGEGEAQQA